MIVVVAAGGQEEETGAAASVGATALGVAEVTALGEEGVA
jgi:hypothetical protein